MVEKIYNDFGSRIDGAKKFLYSPISNNQGYGFWKVTKNSLWPEPETGKKDRFVEFLIYKFRDCIRNKFKTDDEELFIEFKNQLVTIKSLMDGAETEDDVISIIKFFEEGKDKNGIPLFNHDLLMRKSLKIRDLTRSQMEIEGFGISKREQFLKQAQDLIQCFIINDSFRYEGNTLKFSSNGRKYQFQLSPNITKDDLIEGRLIFIQNLNVSEINQTSEDYQLKLEDLIDMLFVEDQIKNKKKRLHYPYLEVLRHLGSEYRHGKSIKTSEFQERFLFYGGQFGNWLTQTERAKVINLAYDAFCDLAVALNIEDSDISLNNRLGISFGARGTGHGSAHYEPKYHVINLTRNKGAGSLAHEWGHSLDHYLSEVFGTGNQLLTQEKIIKLPSLNNIVKELVNYKNTYRIDSIALDSYEGRKKPYWASTSEMFARAFNCFIIDKLKSLGIINDYLCFEFDISIQIGDNHTASSNPQGKEREHLNELFDILIKDLKDKGLLHERNEKTSNEKLPKSINNKISINSFNQISFLW